MEGTCCGVRVTNDHQRFGTAHDRDEELDELLNFWLDSKKQCSVQGGSHQGGFFFSLFLYNTFFYKTFFIRHLGGFSLEQDFLPNIRTVDDISRPAAKVDHAQMMAPFRIILYSFISLCNSTISLFFFIIFVVVILHFQNNKKKLLFFTFD